MTLTIRKVETKQDFNALLKFPWTVYKDHPNWTPPLLSMRRDTLDRSRNPAWEYMEGEYFTAWRGDQLVGTIAAIINHRHNEFHKERIGWFGAFDVLNDAEAAAALLKTACDWVISKGYETIRGPQTLTTHEEVGLLIDGFAPPVLLMPYHARYYRPFIEAQGFTKSMDMFSYYYDWEMVQEHNLEARFERLVSRITEKSKLKLRSINRKNLRKDFELFKEIYNAAWASNWGFVPMTEKELDMLIESLGLIFDPDLAGFAEIDGKTVGFVIVVPDLNQVLHAAHPTPDVPEVINLLKVAWHWKVRRVINGSRVPLMGILPEYRNRGFDLVMYYDMMKVLKRKGYHHIDCGWILESNQNMAGTLSGIGMKIHRTYRLYEKSLT
jgi:GNAT superfamily N-acetyltransferase